MSIVILIIIPYEYCYYMTEVIGILFVFHLTRYLTLILWCTSKIVVNPALFFSIRIGLINIIIYHLI